ncbi:flagellar hook-length control protein FliK [Pantoea sp. BAV 3049]|uniref:flagellar hook-length control protein FliK n=1 Tax=Pantoea sp. BAV 3049 TaxID=2654188 RepID=UPI00131A85AF|nr:flagellar hook-length control protein FliK [Pantoea sp. BAV 3049]
MNVPFVTSGTKVSSTTTASTSATAATDPGTETSATGVGETAHNSGSQGFLTLLGNKLLTLAKQGETAAQNTHEADSEAAGASSKAKINSLLASQDLPEKLNALLQKSKVSTDGKDETATDSTEAASTASATLSTSDMQALQALFAMLPPAPQQPTDTLTAKGGDTLESDGSIKGGKTTLASLLSGKESATSDDEATSKAGDKSGKIGNTTLTAVTGSQKSTTDTSATNTAFQQVLSSVTRDADKENSSSAPAPTITNNVISAASAALTPATTTLVTAPATSQLSSQLGSPEWQQALGQQIVMFSRNGQQTAELHLHPQDLGSIQISLKLDNDQAQLNMVSGNSHVRAALEAALPQLRTALAESGINLGQSNVSSDAFQQGQSFSGQQGQQQNNSRGNTFSLASENDGDVTPIAVPAALQARAAGSSAVDIFA